jgi:NAD-dependent dihydropyrimidine dehydrogenase PreA subunit
MTETNNNSCCSPDSSSKQLSGEVCPFGLPQSIENGKFKITDVNLCTECSACKRNCPVQAIIMLEQKGCGCLWDTRQRIKKKGSMNSCCS